MSKKNRNKNKNRGMSKFSSKFFNGGNSVNKNSDNGNNNDVNMNESEVKVEDSVKNVVEDNQSILVGSGQNMPLKPNEVEEVLKESSNQLESVQIKSENLEERLKGNIEGENETMDKEMDKMMEEVKAIQDMEKDSEKDDDFVSQYSEEYKKVLQENCDMLIPTKWNMYLWAEKHPKTTIASAIKRVEKVFDFTDGGALQLGFSSGKDSTVSANLACLELNLRKLRCKYVIDREGNHRIDPLDVKWANQRLTMAETDAEVVFTSSNDYSKAFLSHMGPEEKFDLGGQEYLADDMLKLANGTKDTAKNIFNRVMAGEEIEINQ